MTALILLVAALWLIALVCSVLAVVFLVLGQTRHLWLSGLLAITGTVIGGMGVSAWTPFGFFPEIGYTRSSGTFELSIRSNWLFIAPLVLGGVAILLTLWKCWGRKTPE